jgi:hypothetical protein
MPDGEHSVDIPMLGRARLVGDHYAVHLFGLINPSIVGDPATFLPFTARRALNRDKCRSRTGVFRIAMGGREVQRSGTFGPLTDTQFFSGAPFFAPPSGIVSSADPRSRIKIAVNYDDATPSGRSLLYDVGQTIDLVADCIDVELVMPAGFVDVANTVAVPLVTGLVLDAQISVGIWELEAPIGEFRGHLTETLFVPANVTTSIRVPDGTKEVQIFQSSLGDAAVGFTEWYGDPNVLPAAQEHGAIFFEPGLRQTARKTVGNTSHLRSDIDTMARFFTLVWQIEP